MEMENLGRKNCKVGDGAGVELSVERYFCGKTPFHYLHLDFYQRTDTALQTGVVLNSVSSDCIKKIADALTELADIVRRDEELAFALRQNEANNLAK